MIEETFIQNKDMAKSIEDIEKIRLAELVANCVGATKKVSKLWSTSSDEINNSLKKKYPFDKPFDKVVPEFKSWQKELNKKIGISLKKLKVAKRTNLGK